MTLDELAAAIDRAPSQVSMIENGHREPQARRCCSAIAPRARHDARRPAARRSRRASAPRSRSRLERAQRGPVVRRRSALAAVPRRKTERRGLQARSSRCRGDRAPAPTSVRRHPRRRGARTSSCGARCSARDNYFPELEEHGAPSCSRRSTTPADRCRSGRHPTSPAISGSPCTTSPTCRSRPARVTDIKQRPHLPAVEQSASARLALADPAGASRRTCCGHESRRDYADFLRQRVETNYLTGGAPAAAEAHAVAVPAGGEERPRASRSRTCATRSPSRTRRPRTASPTSRRCISASRCTS